jgi:hypothetical protein
VLAGAEHLEHAEPQRVAESLQLLRPVDRQDIPKLCWLTGHLNCLAWHGERIYTDLLPLVY